MTFEQAFLKVKEKFEKADATGIDDFALQVTLSDEDCGGTFYATVTNGKLAVEPYDYWDNDTAIDITRSALLAYLAGRMTIETAMKNGEATVHGDVQTVKNWKNTMKKPAKKKTTTTKKKVANKTTRQKQMRRR